MQQQMAAYAGTSITTELIQKYLDENKQLILAILDNQNLGKLNECATYQAKLQQNLMYLAAIADAQPQGGQSSAQVAPAQSMQAAQPYLQQQQQQQQQQMMMNQRNSVPQYMQQNQQGSPHQSQQSQQSYHNQQGMSAQGNSGLHMMSNDTSVGGNGHQATGAMAGASRDGNQLNMNMRGDAPSSADPRNGGNGTTVDDS